MQHDAQAPTDDTASASSGAMFSRRRGVELDVVYCLCNEGMPGLYKIGFTSLTAEIRARHLYDGYGNDYTTGVPFPFQVVREWEVPSGHGEEVEKSIHRHLRARRKNPKREFFTFADSREAIAEIEGALRELDWYLTAVADAERKADEAARRTARKKAEAEAAQREQARVNSISSRVKLEMASQAEAALRGPGVSNGLKWAGIVGVSFLVFGELLNAKDAFLWIVLAAAIGAYYWNRGTPLETYLGSGEYKARVAAAIDQAVMSDPSASSSIKSSQNRPVQEGALDPEGSGSGRRPTAQQECVAPLPPSPDALGVAVAKRRWQRVVSARCPSCSCLHEVDVSRGSFVRVHCERCGGAFETEADIATEAPEEHASRVYLVTFAPRPPPASGSSARSESQCVAEGLATARPRQPTGPIPLKGTACPPEGISTSSGLGDTSQDECEPEDAPFEPAIADCPRCGYLKLVNARNGRFVRPTCEGCGGRLQLVAQAPTVEGK